MKPQRLNMDAVDDLRAKGEFERMEAFAKAVGAKLGQRWDNLVGLNLHMQQVPTARYSAQFKAATIGEVLVEQGLDGKTVSTNLEKLGMTHFHGFVEEALSTKARAPV